MNGDRDRLKIAVFIDFDNIEIGVKSTLNRHFDIGAVLEAIKEKGEVVTKIAYGDWKRAGEHSRGMTQHAIQMVQRNLTPGGDKNGADINLALDALEMAFTRNHINTFVIVGGDSDFIALVEKLKQYDKQVFIVGGRAFTSSILQKNCHEFIAYENLLPAPSQQTQRRQTEKSRGPGFVDPTSLSKAVPLVRRALKVLADREVSPQLGLLKSTLLQLDSTFSERDYGTSTFRDFIEKMAVAGYVTLKQVDRSLLVEMKDHETGPLVEEQPEQEMPQPAPPAGEFQGTRPVVQGPLTSSALTEEGVRIIKDAFQNPKFAPHWPMYLRNVKQFVKNAAPTWDERKYGFASFLEAVRAAQRAGILKLERNRQGILRVYPGNVISQLPPPPMPLDDDLPSDEPMMMDETGSAESEPIIEAAPVEEVIDVPVEPVLGDEGAPETEPVPIEEEAKHPRKKKAVARKKPAAKIKTGVAKRARKKATDEEPVSD
jgi:uncharacterized LabA/DUF88 family protein